ncbi:MAG: B12-binding domain-containing radical SAM protein, partial [Bacteroidales bacterium]
MIKNKLSLLWLDLNASFAHSSLALPAIHAQTIHTDLKDSVEWDLLQATLHMPVSSIVNSIIEKQPDILAATA